MSSPGTGCPSRASSLHVFSFIAMLASTTCAGPDTRLKFCLLLTLGLLAAGSPGSAQEDPSLLSLDRIFTDREFAMEQHRAVSWQADDSGYLIAEPVTSGDDKGPKDLVFYSASTGEREVVLSAARLVPPAGSTPLHVDDFSWSEDRSVFLFSVRSSAPKGEEEFWIWRDGPEQLHRLARDGGAGPISNAQLSATGERVAFVSGSNLYVKDLSSGKTVQLTDDGTDSQVNATAEGVYSGLNVTGFRWSPMGSGSPTSSSTWRASTGSRSSTTPIPCTRRLGASHT